MEVQVSLFPIILYAVYYIFYYCHSSLVEYNGPSCLYDVVIKEDFLEEERSCHCIIILHGFDCMVGVVLFFHFASTSEKETLSASL